MTRFAADRYDAVSAGGPVITAARSDRRPEGSRPDGGRPDGGRASGKLDREAEEFDFARLERTVVELANAYRRERRENAALRREIEQRNQQIRALDGRLIAANQKRQDVAKRIDELIAQIDQLDASFARADA